jgi:hypothetical protein
MDPTQIQQLLMTALQQQMEVTNDDDWKAISDRVLKVAQAQADNTAGGFNIASLMRIAFANQNGGGGFGGPNGGGPGGGGGRGGRNGFGGAGGGLLNSTPLPESDALQRAIDAKSSDEQLKAAIDKLAAARKARLDKLVKAQNDLREVLTVRQEAIATELGLL